MLKLIFFGIGFFLLIEGLFYFFLAGNLKDFYKILSEIKKENLRFFSTILIISGLCLIYFTLKFYKI
jgi:uncharacterized protein YjeT (DUF2065 family)